MKLFRKDTKCVKCGDKGASTEYVSSTAIFHGKGIHAPGYIKRKCRVCGFIWTEKPLDSKEDNSQ